MSSLDSRICSFVVAGDPDQYTGGYRYDARIVAGLRTLGWTVTVSGLPGRFPLPDDTARHALDACLGSHAPGAQVVIDGLALGGLPEVARAHAERLQITALVHHPLADETGLDARIGQQLFDSERAALACARRIITTSRFTARRLADFGVTAARIQVVEPGVDKAPLAAAERTPPKLLCVASLVPRKGHDVLIEALAQLRNLGWRCDLIGSLSRDPAHVAMLRAAIQRAQLQDRIHLLGERSPEQLQAHYLEADVFVLPSHYEGYGMVITEAIAHGLPVITTTGGALADTLPAGAGLAVPPGAVEPFTAALRAMLEDDALRQRLRAGARTAREHLHDWTHASQLFADALTTSTPAPTQASTP